MATGVFDDADPDDDHVQPIPSTGGFRVGRHYLFFHDNAEYVCTRIGANGNALFEACTETDHPESFERPRLADHGVLRLVQHGENPDGDVTTDEEGDRKAVGDGLLRLRGLLSGGGMETLGDVPGPVSKALSASEVQEIASGCKIVRYPDLAEYPTWAALMGSTHKVAVLFLVSSPTDGHWIALFDAPDGPHVFDPLGVALDAEREYISTGAAAALGETRPQFARLLRTAPGKARVSRAKFQRDAPGVNTCGRWSGLRLRQRAMTDPTFQAFVQSSSRSSGLRTDAWVDKVTGGTGN
jgi:hypothetical protein